MIKMAFVTLWGKELGRVTWDDNRDLGMFEYDKDFWTNNWNVSPIKMEVKPRDYKLFYFPGLNWENSTFKGLPGLLADSLPDKYGNELIDAWLKSQGRLDSLNPIETLCFIGSRGIGALEFHPAYSGLSEESVKLDVDSLVKVASEIATGRRDFRSRLVEDEKYILDIVKIGTSVGGMRAKAIIAYNPKTKEVRSGQVDAPPGFSHWIIKFDGVSQGVLGEGSGHGRIEMAYHKMAKDCGIEMSECQLFHENGRAHFMTKRFDRIDNKKIHMQSWCALTHNDYNLAMGSYEDLFKTMRSLKVPSTDYEQAYRRMVFNVLAMNFDDHTKNFAFLMDENGKWKLSPAYDITHSYNPKGEWTYKHASKVNGQGINITNKDMMAFAQHMEISKSDDIISKIRDVIRQWPFYARQQNVDPKKIDEIQNLLIQK